MRVHLDFETRSEVDLELVGGWEYASHPSTEILCAAIAVNDNPIQTYDPRDKTTGHSLLLKWMVDLANHPEAIWVAHNAAFEQLIWFHILHKRMGLPALPETRWMCTMAKAAAFGLPLGLDQLASALNLKERKDKDGHRLMLKMSKPRKATKHNDAKWHESPEDYERLLQYNRQDIVVERAVDKRVRDLSPFEQRVWELDQRINNRGMQVDTQAVEASISLIETHKETILKEFKSITGGYVEKPSQVAKLQEWCNANGFPLPNLQAETVDDYIERGIVSGPVLRALRIRRELSRTSTAKYYFFRDSTGTDGRIRGMFQYHAAGPGRWGGRGVQPHNFPRGTVDTSVSVPIVKCSDYDWFSTMYPSLMEALSSNLRGMFISAPGKKLYVGDFAAIEARVLAWLTGEEQLLEMFRRDEDTYCYMASKIYDRPITKKNKAERQMGKVSVLGCGYQMGWYKFMITNKVPEELARECVTTFRQTFTKIVKYWEVIEYCAKECVRTKNNIRCGKITFGMYTDPGGDEFLMCKLPSGRMIAYHKPELRMMEAPWSTPENVQYKETLTYMGLDQKTKQYVRQKTYGGMLTENVVQGIARDLLVETMFKLEEAEYWIVLHVHDEDVSETDEDFGTLEEFESLMAQPPTWASDLPIKVEAWEGTRYRK